MWIRALVEDAASRILSALWTSESFFDPEGRYDAWRPVSAKAMVARLQRVTSDDESASSLPDKLIGASRGEVVLAAELTFLLLLPAADFSAGQKIRLVNGVLAATENSGLTLSPAMSGVVHLLDDPAFNESDELRGLRADNIPFYERLVWLLTFIAQLGYCDECSMIDADEWLDDHCKHESCPWLDALQLPWAFHEYALSLDEDCPSARHFLAYLMWPKQHVPVVDPDERVRLRDGSLEGIGHSSGDDEISIARDLYLIRQVGASGT